MAFTAGRSQKRTLPPAVRPFEAFAGVEAGLQGHGMPPIRACPPRTSLPIIGSRCRSRGFDRVRSGGTGPATVSTADGPWRTSGTRQGLMASTRVSGAMLCPTDKFEINEHEAPHARAPPNSLKHELGGLRTGRARHRCLSRLPVDATAIHMQLNQLETISVPERAFSVPGYGTKSMSRPWRKANRRFQHLGLVGQQRDRGWLKNSRLNEEAPPRSSLKSRTNMPRRRGSAGPACSHGSAWIWCKKLEKNHEIYEDDQERLANE